MIITPQSTISAATAAESRSSKFTLYETSAQKYSFLTSLGTLILGAIGGIVSRIYGSETAAISGLLSLLISSLLAATYQLLVIIPELRKLQNIEREAAHSLINDFDSSVDLIANLARTCEAHHLEFAAARFMLAARHMRERISILVGALEKVGIIPLAGTAFLTWMKIQGHESWMLNNVEFVLVGVLALYLLAVRMTFTVQWLERMANLYDHAQKLAVRKAIKV